MLGRSPLVVQRNLMIARHNRSAVVAEVFEPVLYLLAIGFGIGRLVGDVPGLPSGTVGYAAYVAPALLATSAMNGALNETTLALFMKLRFERTYEPMLTTPLTVRDIVYGEVMWAMLRGTTVCVGFLAFVSLLGLVQSPWVLLAIPGAAVIGFSFAAVGMAVTTYLRSWSDFQWIQLTMLPMFLFATTFYPITVYPGPIQAIVRCLPLYHAIELLRGPALHGPGPQVVIATVYLLALGVLGSAVAVARLRRTLLR
jgi:lipooligosaccharide transport system permease protein